MRTATKRCTQAPRFGRCAHCRLHFDEALLVEIDRRGARVETLTLHVGAGRFQPLRDENLDAHVMRSERLQVSTRLCEAVAVGRRGGGRIVAVGTTVVRALETATDAEGGVLPYNSETDLFIRPGYRFHVPDVVITNFHLPETTLFVLSLRFYKTAADIRCVSPCDRAALPFFQLW